MLISQGDHYQRNMREVKVSLHGKDCDDLRINVEFLNFNITIFDVVLG